jgi:hypothetical protein
MSAVVGASGPPCLVGCLERIARFEERRLVERDGVLVDVEAAEAGRDADDGDDPFGRFDGQVERDLAAVRVADQGRAIDAERVEDGADVRPVRVLDVVGLRPAVAAPIEPDRAIAGRGQVRGEGLPGPGVGHAGVDQEDGRVRGRADVGDEEPAAGHGHEGLGHRRRVPRHRRGVTEPGRR